MTESLTTVLSDTHVLAALSGESHIAVTAPNGSAWVWSTAMPLSQALQHANQLGLTKIIDQNSEHYTLILNEALNQHVFEPISTQAPSTQLQRFLGPAKIFTHQLTNSQDITNHLFLIDDYLQKQASDTFGTERRQDIQLVAAEVLMNSIYHSNRLPNGQWKYTKGQEIEALLPSEFVTLSYGLTEDLQHFYLSVADQGGTLQARNIFYGLNRHYNGEGLLDTHGRGFFLIHMLTDVFRVYTRKHYQTEILAGFSAQSATTDTESFKPVLVFECCL